MVLGLWSAAIPANRCLLVIALTWICWVPASYGANLPRQVEFTCTHGLRDSVVARWREYGRSFIRDELLGRRLVDQRDVYALYDIQTYVANLLAMARRCNDRDLLGDIADLLLPAFQGLERDPVDDARKWICRGGAICSKKNRLVDTEVMLVSAQFLALTSALSNAISAVPAGQRSAAMNRFLREAALVARAHVARWGRGPFGQALATKIAGSPADIRDGSSGLLFTDKELWLIAIIAELAGIAEREPSLVKDSHAREWTTVGETMKSLLALFHRRITLLPLGSASRGMAADLDRGYWRLYADNRYAGYAAAEPPARCIHIMGTKGTSMRRLEVAVPADRVPTVPSGGWDISHARRLVHALDAIVRNGEAVAREFGIESATIPGEDVRLAFANALVKWVWNRDERYPLFANFWDGSNGWYRVAYDNGTGQCRVGTPPFGLTDAFATGGYAAWGEGVPKLTELAWRLLLLSRSEEPEDQQFMRRYYPNFSDKAAGRVRTLSELMFLPSLVGVE